MHTNSGNKPSDNPGPLSSPSEPIKIAPRPKYARPIVLPDGELQWEEYQKEVEYLIGSALEAEETFSPEELEDFAEDYRRSHE